VNAAIIVISGLPGTGKSTLAKELEKLIPNSLIIKSTQLRITKVKNDFFNENLAEIKLEKDRAYNKMIELAQIAIKEGKLPILDATFHKKYRRDFINKYFSNLNTLKIHLNCPETIAKKRISKRKFDSVDGFLNDPTSYDIMKIQSDKIEKNEEFITIDSSKLNAREAAKWIIQHLL